MTSLVFAFNGIGQILANLIAVYIVNPEDNTPTIKSMKGDIEYRYYHADIANNVPLMFRYFVYAEVVILIVALYCIWIPPYELDKEDEIKLPIYVDEST